MTAAGTTVVLAAEFYAYPGGSLIDVTGLTVQIAAPGGALVVGPTSTGVTETVDGVYAYPWAVPADAVAGNYVVDWHGTANGKAVSAQEVVPVELASTGTWATPADVLAVTGATVDLAALAQAQAVIDLAAGVPYVAGGYAGRPGVRSALRLAVAYQAAWMTEQPDMFLRSNVTDYQQDGASGTFGPDGLLLAPLAAMALRRLPWRQTRSIGPRRGAVTTAAAAYTGPGVYDRPDDMWRPL